MTSQAVEHQTDGEASNDQQGEPVASSQQASASSSSSAAAATNLPPSSSFLSSSSSFSLPHHEPSPSHPPHHAPADLDDLILHSGTDSPLPALSQTRTLDGGGESIENSINANGDDGEEDGEDEESEYEDEDEDDEEEEEEEPKLKYQRLGASVTTILKKDSAKVLLASEKFLVLGTASGRLYVLDLNGNEILQFHPHQKPINDLSLDSSGDHVASCSNDGTVVITNLFTKDISKHTYSRSVKSVALPGQYGQSNMFASGGGEGKFMIHTKGWFSAKDHVIHGGEGPIHAIKWRGELLAWANDAGVKIYDVNTSERITHISRIDPNSPPPPPAEQFRCNLCWSKPDTLVIGWADSVKIGVVKSRGPASSHAPGSGSRQFGPTTQSQNRYVQIVAMFNTEYMIAGIAPWGPNHLVIMAFLEDEEQHTKRVVKATENGGAGDKNKLPSPSHQQQQQQSQPTPHMRKPGNSQRPELRIVTLANEEVSADALPIMGYEKYMASDYRLDYSFNGVPPVSMSAPSPSAAAATAPPSTVPPHLLSPPSALSSPSSLSVGIGVPSSLTPVAPPVLAASNASLEYLFYILAPSDIVVAKPRDYDDHVAWLLQRQRYEEALHYAQTYEHALKLHSPYLIGENFLKHLLEVERNYSKAAEYCRKLLGTSKSLWETYIYTFIQHDKLAYIADVIPITNPTLSEAIYELILQHYITDGMTTMDSCQDGSPESMPSHGKLLHFLRTWPCTLYRMKVVIESIRVQLDAMERKAKEVEGTIEGRRRESEREQSEKHRRQVLEHRHQLELQSTPEAKKAFYQTSLSLTTKIGELNKKLYPPPPMLPTISTLLLLESLGELYMLNKQYSLAFDVYLRLQKKDELFRILNGVGLNHQGGNGVPPSQLLELKLLDERLIPTLMRIDLTKTIELLILHVERITPSNVMEQLRAMPDGKYEQNHNHTSSSSTSSYPSHHHTHRSSQSHLAPPSFAAVSAGGVGAVVADADANIHPTPRVFQYEYLHALFRRDHSLGVKFHDDQVLLYAEFQPKELMYFLKNSNGYLLERALESCEKYKLYSEMVFLLKRMGNTLEALKLLIDELHDVREAIAFVEENGGRLDGTHVIEDGSGIGDQSLWEELITRSLNNPEFLSDLLEHVGSHYVDLSKLIKRIPNELEIPKLKHKLITILNDCALQQSVIKGCTNILKNDCKSLIERLYRRRKRAIKVTITNNTKN